MKNQKAIEVLRGDALKEELDKLETIEDLYFFVESQSVHFEYTNEEIIEILRYGLENIEATEKEREFLLTYGMQILEDRGFSFAYLLYNLNFSISKYYDYVLNDRIDEIGDTVLQFLLRKLRKWLYNR